MRNSVTILGSGTCVSSLYHPFDFRNESGHLVEYNGINILLDCGEGMRGQLDKIHFDYFDLDAIFITHFHPDHFNLESLIQSIYVRARRTNTKKRLRIFGPPRSKVIVETIWNLKRVENSFQEELLPVLDLQFEEYKSEKPIRLTESIVVVPHSVYHKEMDA